MVLYLLSYHHEEGKGHGSPQRLEPQNEDRNRADLYEIHHKATVYHITVFQANILSKIIVDFLSPYEAIVTEALPFFHHHLIL